MKLLTLLPKRYQVLFQGRKVPGTFWAMMLVLMMGSSVFAEEITEVVDTTYTQVIVREHPKTQKSYISITDSTEAPENPFSQFNNQYARPDYRMLDPKLKKGDYEYEGPYSNRTKVYIFGASLIAVGLTGATAGIALAPATGAASTGGGAYLAAGAAVAAAEGLAIHQLTKVRPEDENFIHESETQFLELIKLEDSV